MHETELLLMQLAGLIVLGVSSQYVAHFLKVPSIIVLLLVGLFVGPVMARIWGPHLDPDHLLGHVLMPIVSLSVGLILYEGGLTLRFKDIPGVGHVIRNLVTFGAAITWLGAALGAHYIAGLEWWPAVLLGAILVVTGPTVIDPMVRHIKPSGSTGPVLRWEGIVIDPIGALLAVLVFETLLVMGTGSVGAAALDVAKSIVLTVVVGGALGLAGALVLVVLLKKYWVPDALANPVSMMLVLAAFVASNLVQQESGLLAATVMGIALANQRWADVEHIIEFKENVRVLLLSVLFIVLAARVDLDSLLSAALPGLGLAALLILVVRPLSVFASTADSPLSTRQRAFIAWMAPRGIVAAAVASVFSISLADLAAKEDATEHVIRIAEQVEPLVPVTFVVIIATVTVYGLTGPFLARRLKIADSRAQGVLFVGAHSWAREMAKALKERGISVLLVDTNRQNVVTARMAGLGARAGGVLSEDVIASLDLTGIGRLLALTPNHEVNALAAQRFTGAFGRAEVYQLSPGEGKDVADIPHGHGGRVLFNKGATFAALASRFGAGAQIRTTTLTDEFDYDDYLKKYGGRAVPLFVIGSTGRLRVIAADDATEPQPGQSIMALVDKDAEPAEPDGRAPA